MYASAIPGKPIPEHRIQELIGPEYRDTEQNWSQEWEPRDRDSAKEPVPKWDGKNVATTLRP
eukprot:1072447-Karenia_brevis.AAC.1